MLTSCHVPRPSSTRRLFLTLQAVVLHVKLPHLEDWIAARRANAREYCRLLGDVPLVRLPIEHANERGVYHTFVIQAEQMQNRGVQVVDCRNAFHRFVAELICRTIAESTFHAGAG